MTKKPKLTALDSQTEEKTMSEFYNDITVDVLARTLWGEARGEGTQGMLAVANVILNRVKVAEAKGSFWWGNNVIQVCQKPYQFSCWNRSDPNFKKLQMSMRAICISPPRCVFRAALSLVASMTLQTAQRTTTPQTLPHIGQKAENLSRSLVSTNFIGWWIKYKR